MDEQVKKIEKYEKIICKNLVATDVLPHLMSIDTIAENAVCHAIYDLQAHNPYRAAKVLVDKLIKSKQPGWYKLFVEALIEKGYEIISRALEHGKEPLKDQIFFEQLLYIYYLELCDQIEPLQLLSALIQTGCFIEDAERVHAAHNSRGKSYATLCLLLNIHRRSGDWFKGFMYVLTTNGHKGLVDAIEPKIRIAAEKGYQETGKAVDKFRAINQGAREECEGSLSSKGTVDRDSGYTEPKSKEPNPQKSHQAKSVGSWTTSSTGRSHASAKPNKGDRNGPGSSAAQFTSIDGCSSSVKSMVHMVPPPPGEPLSLNLNENNQPPDHLMGSLTCSSGLSDLSKGSEMSSNDQYKASNMSSGRDERQNSLSYKSDPGIELESPNKLKPDASMSMVEDTVLRKYQQELVQAAMQGKNSIIYAPKGASKTFTAMAVAKHKLEGFACGPTKVIHVVLSTEDVKTTVALYERYLPDRTTTGVCTEPGRFTQELPTTDVCVTTLKLFVQVLQGAQSLALGVFALMVLTINPQQLHQLQAVMSRYFLEKQNGKSTPQILGLLDSLHLGAASDETVAKDNILKLCAQFDSCICRVTKHKSDLARHVGVTDQEFYSVQGRKQDSFCICVTGLMVKIEGMIKQEKDGSKEVDVVKKKLKQLPSHKGCREYKMWLKSLQKPVAKLEEAERRVYEAYFFNLRTYNDALMINEDCQTSDAIDFIEKKIDDHCKYDTDKRLQKMFKEKKAEMTENSRLSSYANPKLKQLKEIIQDYHDREKKKLKAVLFCKSMNIAEWLEKWVSNDESLEEIRAKKISFSPEGKDENHVLKYYRNGKAGIVITDDKSEDFMRGLESCNCVIHYMLGEDSTTSGKPGTIDVRGKARGDKDCDKEKYIKGLQLVSELPEDELRQDIAKYQPRYSTGKHQTQAVFPSENGFDTENSVKFRCGGEGCKVIACYSSQIKKKCKMEVVIGGDFMQKAETKKQPPEELKNDMQVVGSLWCKKCPKCKWGSLVECKSTQEQFCVVTVSSFTLEYPDRSERKFRRWADVTGFRITVEE